MFLRRPQNLESANNVSPGTLRERAATLKVAEPVNARALPTRFHNARNLALERQTAEAQTADTELAQIRARTAAQLAAVVLTGLELRLLCGFDALCSGSHISLTFLFPYAPWRNGMPKAFSSSRAPLSSLAVVTIV